MTEFTAEKLASMLHSVMLSTSEKKDGVASLDKMRLEFRDLEGRDIDEEAQMCGAGTLEALLQAHPQFFVRWGSDWKATVTEDVAKICKNMNASKQQKGRGQSNRKRERNQSYSARFSQNRRDQHGPSTSQGSRETYRQPDINLDRRQFSSNGESSRSQQAYGPEKFSGEEPSWPVNERKVLAKKQEIPKSNSSARPKSTNKKPKVKLAFEIVPKAIKFQASLVHYWITNELLGIPRRVNYARLLNISNDSHYAHMLVPEEFTEFDKMMADIEAAVKYYPDRHPTRFYREGDGCLVELKDGKYYRGIVLGRVDGRDELDVFLMDIGKREIASSNYVFPMPESICQINTFGLKCILPNGSSATAQLGKEMLERGQNPAFNIKLESATSDHVVISFEQD